jgi:threonine synthase
LFDVEHPVAQSGCDLKGLFDVRARDSLRFSAGAERSGVWRYRELVMPAPLGEVVSYPEGNTALLERAAIASFAEVPALLLKHEGMNPTGSFKDRGMSVALTQAKLTGASAVACASTGNTSSSLAAYAGMAGIPSLVLVPSGLVSAGKLAQTVACGARTLLVRGDFDDCLRLVREAGEHLGVYLVNSVNPFRIEGQKTIVFEMIQQLGWESPDWIALPAGNLGNAAAFGKAIRELKERDIIAKVPRLLLVQAEGAAPFVRSFRDEFRVRHRIHANTVATAIRIGDPASYDRAVRSVRETDGVVTDVTDDEILEAMGVINSSGVGCEPASAASVAGVRKMVAAGVIPAGARVVAVLTGHLLKDAGVTMSPGRSKETGAPRQPVEVDPTLAAVEAALRG